MFNLGTILDIPLVPVTSNHVYKLSVHWQLWQDVFVYSMISLHRRTIEKIAVIAITLQIGFMNNGVIKAADVEYYVNGGCTPDESEMVRNMPFP